MSRNQKSSERTPAACAAPEEERVVTIFRALHGAFRFSGSMPEDIRHWLYGEQQKAPVA